MTSSKNVAFVLVPGGFSPGSYFHKVTERLTALGYDSYEIDLPTVGNPDKPQASVYDDAAEVRSAVERFADQGKSVVVAGNSYGGFVATEAVKGTTKAEREKEGKTGALTHLVYLGSLIPPLGATIVEVAGDSIPVDVSAAGDFLDPPPPEAGALLVGSLPREEVLHYGSLLRLQSTKAMTSKLTHAGYLYVPVTFVISENDKAVNPQKSHENVDKAIKDGVDVRKLTLPTDHCAMVTMPDEVTNILLEAAGEK